MTLSRCDDPVTRALSLLEQYDDAEEALLVAALHLDSARNGDSQWYWSTVIGFLVLAGERREGEGYDA
jgi:hypothetical protein